MDAPLRQVDNDIWVAERPLPLPVGDIGARMTVVRLSSGHLFVHSPVAPDDETCRALRVLGPVTAIVAPNKTHHFFLRRFQRAFPDAETWGAPGLNEKRPEIAFHHVLTDHAPAVWACDIDQVHVSGIPVLQEVVFFHRGSRTLVLTDLAFHMVGTPTGDWRRRLFLRLNGAWDRFGPTRLVRLLIRDYQAFAYSLQRILRWDFDRVIVSHGSILRTGGRQAFTEAFAPWLHRPANA